MGLRFERLRKSLAVILQDAKDFVTTAWIVWDILGVGQIQSIRYITCASSFQKCVYACKRASYFLRLAKR